jgi:membrane-associated progesterone receptor component
MFQETFWAIATPLATPLNLTILLLIATLAYLRLRPSAPPNLPSGPPPIVFRTFTPRTLLPYNGHPSTSNPSALVYLAVNTKVYDVTNGRNFYGPGGPYENFAGRDATRGLACQSFDESMLTKDLDGPLDDIGDLGEGEKENLRGWVERFDEKVRATARLRMNQYFYWAGGRWEKTRPMLSV